MVTLDYLINIVTLLCIYVLYVRCVGFVSWRSRVRAPGGSDSLWRISSPTSVSCGAVVGYWQGVGVYWLETQETRQVAGRRDITEKLFKAALMAQYVIFYIQILFAGSTEQCKKIHLSKYFPSVRNICINFRVQSMQTGNFWYVGAKAILYLASIFSKHACLHSLITIMYDL